jgi:YegS/Rv2252/BmrU family lipid kinase
LTTLAVARGHTYPARAEANAMRTCVIFNPVAKGNKARQFRAHLGELSGEAELRATSKPREATQLATQAIAEGFQTIVAAGGDGTLNEVVSGFAEAGRAGEQARLGVIPLGTVNVFARELGIPLQARAAWRVVMAGRERRIDMPVAEFQSRGKPCARAFAQLAGAGLDALAVERVSWTWKKLVGPLAYVMSGLSAMWARHARIRAEAGNESAEGELILIGNGRLYGGNFELFPGAQLDDGLLDVTIFSRVTWLALLRCGISLVTRGRLPKNAARHFRTEAIKLSSTEHVPFELDGELVGELPVTFRGCGRKLRVVVP